MKPKKKIDNIVRIGGIDRPEVYVNAILVRMSPTIYNEFKCIIIQVTASRLEFAESLINRWKPAGLREVNRKKKPIKGFSKSGGSYILPEAYEIELKKIPYLEALDEE